MEGESAPGGSGFQGNRRMQRLAYAMLLVMAFAAFMALRIDVTSYISSHKSVRGLKLDIADLRVIDDENPRALIRFRVQNDSLLEIELDEYLFDLYLEGELIGNSYSMYRGTNPNVDPGIYLKAQAIGRVLDSGQTIDLEFTLFIHSAKMEIVRHVRPAGPAFWSAKADFTLFMPYSRKEILVKLKAGYKG